MTLRDLEDSVSGDKGGISIEMKDDPFESSEPKKDLTLEITGENSEEFIKDSEDKDTSEPITDDKKEIEEVSKKETKDITSEEKNIENEDELLDAITDELKETVENKEDYSNEKPIPKEKFKKRLEKQKEGFLHQLMTKDDKVSELERQIEELRNQRPVQQQTTQPVSDDEIATKVELAINSKQMNLGRELSTAETLGIYDRIRKEEDRKAYQIFEQNRNAEYFKTKEKESIGNLQKWGDENPELYDKYYDKINNILSTKPSILWGLKSGEITVDDLLDFVGHKSSDGKMTKDEYEQKRKEKILDAHEPTGNRNIESESDNELTTFYKREGYSDKKAKRNARLMEHLSGDGLIIDM